MITSRERVLKTYNFEQTDRVPFDLSEARSWPEMNEYFLRNYGLKNETEILEFLDSDFRWVESNYEGPCKDDPRYWGFLGKVTYSAEVIKPPLAYASTIADINAYALPNPAWWKVPDFEAERKKWPDKALVMFPGWMPLFCCACYVFGMDEALVKMAIEPELFEAYLEKHNEFYMEILERNLKKAKGYVDICWLGDDFAGQTNMLMNPDLWRRLIKPHLAKQARIIRDNGIHILFHSCGSVRPILSDLIEIGIDALLVFQTTAKNMDAESIARDFGGKMVFYGGIDSQALLTNGTTEQVRDEVIKNVNIFSKYGGYIVANCHHGLKDIKASNIEVMCKTAREYKFK